MKNDSAEMRAVARWQEHLARHGRCFGFSWETILTGLIPTLCALADEPYGLTPLEVLRNGTYITSPDVKPPTREYLPAVVDQLVEEGWWVAWDRRAGEDAMLGGHYVFACLALSTPLACPVCGVLDGAW